MHHEAFIQSGKLDLNILCSDVPLNDICGFASRQNPKRGFLFVSKVLGKHYPVKPSAMKDIHNKLAFKIDANMEATDKPLFLGFAETATGLASGVYQSWKDLHQHLANSDVDHKSSFYDSYFIHTTRYHLENEEVLFNFEEEHSHATGHIVYKPHDDKFQLNFFNTLVLLDDEITTGKTMTNFIEGFLQLKDCHIKKIIVVSIKNWMVEESTQRFTSLFPAHQISFVEILKGTYSFSKDENFTCDPMPNVDGGKDYKNHLITSNYGRLGINTFQQYDFKQFTQVLDFNKKTLVLGTGEFTFYPFLLAQHLEEKGVDVVFQSTTRSPILIGNDITHKISFIDNYEDNIANFVYNVTPNQYEQIIICYETNCLGAFDLDKKLDAINCFFDTLQKV